MTVAKPVRDQFLSTFRKSAAVAFAMLLKSAFTSALWCRNVMPGQLLSGLALDEDWLL